LCPHPITPKDAKCFADHYKSVDFRSVVIPIYVNYEAVRTLSAAVREDSNIRNKSCFGGTNLAVISILFFLSFFFRLSSCPVNVASVSWSMMFFPPVQYILYFFPPLGIFRLEKSSIVFFFSRCSILKREVVFPVTRDFFSAQLTRGTCSVPSVPRGRHFQADRPFLFCYTLLCSYLSLPHQRARLSSWASDF